MTQHWAANSIMDLIRNVFAFLDLVVYTLLGWMYQILFNVAGWDIFTSETVRGVYSRVQMILGVFMMFRLAITIIQGIINPDTFTDKKAGIGNIITRVVFALIMLTALTPLNISGAGGNSFYTEVNNNGILFGTLYSLQDRILKNNVLGKLILGTNASEEAGDSQTSIANQGEEFTEMGNVFTSTILKSFIRINLKDPDDLGISSDQLNENNASHRMCSNISSGTLSMYNKEDASPSQVLGLINASCETEGGAFASILSGFKRLGGTDRYVFAYLPIISTLVGGILIYILVGEIITIAIRSLKLAVLRVIAPIPVISYIQPSKDNGMYGAWMKSLISTYLELFIHLAVIYFVLYLVQDLITNGFEFPEVGGMIGVFSFIFLIIGLFFFIRMAPKFIMSSLGIKGGGSNVGLAAMFGGAAALLGGTGLAGAAAGALNAAETQVNAYNSGKSASLGDSWTTGRDLAAQILTGDPKRKGGFLNNANDYLTRVAGINAARDRYGVTANGLAIAKKNYQNLEAEAADAKDKYERFTQGNMSSIERDAYLRANHIDDAGNMSIDEQNEAIRTHMYKTMNDKQTAYGKAKGHYDDAKKFADSHRVTPNFEEEHRISFRERIGRGDQPYNRDDYHSSSRRNSAHQTFGDRIFGSPDEWKDNIDNRVNNDDGTPNDGFNPRMDNRWAPNKPSKNNARNAIHGDSNINTDTPGSGGLGGGGHHHH